jgi:hypothetical protein
MSKACQYATNNDKVSKSLMEVNVKDAQATLQKTITWTKKFSEGRQEWEKACIECGLPPQKLKTLVKTKFASKVIMFKETLEFKQTIIIYCERQKIIALQQRVPKAQMWLLQKYSYLKPYGNNLCHESIPWLLSNVLTTAIT